MSLGMIDDLSKIRKLMGQITRIQGEFEALKDVEVKLPDGSVTDAMSEAKALVKQAVDHHVVVDLALKGLLDPKKAPHELEQLVAQAQDHSTELGKFVEQIEALVGAEAAEVTKLIASAGG